VTEAPETPTRRRLNQHVRASPARASALPYRTAGIDQEPPTVAVIVFPGSNDDRDAAWALGALGAEASLVWHAERELPRGTAGIVLPGGFSYGDYLRSGAIARFAPIMEAVEAFASDGGPVLGICNGFQILCEAGLLPGALRPNRTLTFVCRDAALRVERTDLAFTARCEEGQRLTIPIKHGDGCYFADAELLKRLDANRQVVLRFDGENPNGSIAEIAGVANEWGNVMGLMPHPEHAVDPLLGASDGALILAGLVDAAREHAVVAA
jgi:phosphoribosylformylglycinamidine synthase I